MVTVVDIKWLKRTLAARGITQDQAARGSGMTQNMLTKVLNGHRGMSAHEADSMRQFLGYELPENRPPIAVVGRIAAGDHLDLVDGFPKGDGLYKIKRPAWVPASGYVAAEISGSSAEPWALEGDVIFWSRKAIAVMPEDLGRPVVAETVDGRVMLKRLASGYRPGTWTLLSINPTYPTHADLELQWAARVLPPLPKDQIEVVDDYDS